MTICRFFLQNTCRFGDNCRFEHPRGGGAQRNLFGNGNSATSWQAPGQKVTFRDSFGGGGSTGQFSQNNQFKWTASQAQQQTGATAGQPVSAMDLVNALPKEMDTWENSKMWPFSCVSVEKDLSCLPDFYDMSMEEVRLEAYQALANGNIQPYAQKFQTLVTEFQNKRMQLKNMSMDVKRQLANFIEEARKKKSNQISSSILSTTSRLNSATQGSQNLFGSSGSVSQPTGVFGQGGHASSSGLFGNSATNSTFGSNPAASGSSFGGNSASTGSTFGSSGNTPGLFGKPAPSAGTLNSQAQGQNSNLFGNSTKPSLFGGSPLAAPATNTDGLFGQARNQPSLGLFSSTGSSFSNPAAPTGVFGNAAVNPPSIFGGTPATDQTSPANMSAIFGGRNPTPASSAGLFGKPPPPQGLFGKPSDQTVASTTLGGGLFGKSLSLQAGSGTPLSSTPLGGTNSVSSAGADTRKGSHSTLEELSQLDIAAFKAPAFTLGRIPLKPPPLELVNI